MTHTQRSAPAQSSQEPESQHFTFIARETANKVENEVEQIGQLEHNRSSEFLGEGPQKQWAKGIGQHKDTEHQVLLDLIGNLELA